MTDKPLIEIGRGTFRISEDAPQLPTWIYTSASRIAKWLDWKLSSRKAEDWMGPVGRKSK